MSTSIKDPELGEIIFVNNNASFSENATLTDYEALRKAYDIVKNLNQEIHYLRLKLIESDGKFAFMTKLLSETNEQLRQHSLINFKNQVLFEL